MNALRFAWVVSAGVTLVACGDNPTASDASTPNDATATDVSQPSDAGDAASDVTTTADASSDAGAHKLWVGAATSTAWATFVTQVGQPATSRLYATGLPTSWTAFQNADSVGDPPGVLETVISVKPPNGVPAYTATSTDGKAFASLVSSLPTDGRAWRVTIYHEPEDNAASGDFTPAQWRAMQIAAGGQVHALNRADVRMSIILQGFTFLKAGANHVPPRVPSDWWEASMAGAVDYIYFDVYPDLNSGSNEFTTLDGSIGPCETWARGNAKPFGFTEFAVNDKTNDTSAKPAMLTAMIARGQASSDCENLTYFDVKGTHYATDPTYLLQSDTGSKTAWAAGMKASF
jgi:hypothetical protein